MIKIIFEGGYTYNMTNGEYQLLLLEAGIGTATIVVGIGAIGYFLTKKIIKSIKKR